MSLRLWERSDPNVTGFKPPLERYEFAVEFLREGGLAYGLIADAACGCGYGTQLLNEKVEHYTRAVGFDFSDEALAHARGRGYSGAWVKCDIGAQIFDGFDALVCLETVEHLPDPAVFVKNLAVPLLVISTTTYMAHPEIDPWHLHDFNEVTFRALIEPKYRVVKQLAQQFQGVQGLERYLTLACVEAG